MSSVPTSDDLRTMLAALDARQRKIVGGMFALMVEAPSRVREREWIAERLTLVVTLSLDADRPAETPRTAVEEVQSYAREHADPLLNAAFALFHQVGQDLAGRAGDLTFEDALRQATSYFP